MSVAKSLRAKLSLEPLKPSEVETYETHFIERLDDAEFALDTFRRYHWPVYRRIRKIEERHNPLTQGDVVLLSAALYSGYDDNPFDTLLEDSNSWLGAVRFAGDAGPIAVDAFFIAAKFLLGRTRSQILDDEVEKELRRRAQEVGQRKLFEFQKTREREKKARWAAERRVDRARELASAQYPFLIRGFVREMKVKAKPLSSVWVRV